MLYGARAEIATVNFNFGAALRVTIDHDKFPCDRAAMRIGVEPQLLARQALPRRQGLDVIHDRVRFSLFVEATIPPILADIVSFVLGGKVIVRTIQREVAISLRVCANERIVLTVNLRDLCVSPSSR